CLSGCLGQRKCENVFNIISFVAEAGNLVLASEFALATKPAGESVLHHRVHNWHAKSDVLVTLCIIIAVYLPQRRIEFRSECSKICRLLLKLNEPVMRAI